MRDKLIELIAERNVCPSDEPRACEKCQYSRDLPCWAGQIADRLIAHGVTLASDNNVGYKWIPVDERLPEDDYLDYLCQIKEADRGFCRIAICYFEEAFYENDFDCTEKVTHWMPLPTAPKEVE